MKRTQTLTIFLLLLATITHAQVTANNSRTSTDTIEIRKAFAGYQYYNRGKQLKPGDLEQLLSTNEQAVQEFRSSKSSRTFATILSFAGGFMIGWPLGTAIGGGDPNWALAGIGAGLTAVSIPLNVSANKRVRSAVDLYNMSRNTSSFFKPKELNLQVTGSGIGLAFKL